MPADMAPRPSAAVSTLLRVLAAVFGGYVFTASTVAALASVLCAAGMARSEASVTSALLGFPVYLVVALWAFSVSRLLRLGAVLASGTAIAGGLVWLMR